MAMPAVPAMPTAEYSSPAKTFSMSRLAMMLPMVARRSPAITTPPSNVAVTMVVPWGASSELPGGRLRPDGSRWGAWAPMNSVKDEEPAARYAAGSLPASGPGLTGSLPALLDEATHELLGVRLEDAVDLVQH